MRHAQRPAADRETPAFPFLFGGTFIEAERTVRNNCESGNFPSFSEGLSLRLLDSGNLAGAVLISLPFRRDFH